MLTAEIVLIGIGAVCAVRSAAIGADAFLVPVCLTLGSQNGASGKIGSVSFHTTFIPGSRRRS